MNSCIIKMYGSVKELIKFMVNDMNFMRVNDRGVQFTAEIRFAESMKQMDEMFLKENYGVEPVSVCKKLKVSVNHHFYDEYGEEDLDDYDDEDSVYKDVYKFEMFKCGSNLDPIFNVYKEFEDCVCFKHQYVKDNREFMDKFFKCYSLQDRFGKEMKHKLNDHMYLELELFTYSLPVEVFEQWIQEYDIRIVGMYSDEKAVTVYDRFHGEVDNEFDPERHLFVYDAEKDRYMYTKELLVHGWADKYAICIDICDMLFDMKDHIPFKIDLELHENKDKVSRSPYKYNAFYNSVSNFVFSLSRSNPDQLAKVYVGLEDAYKEFKERK